MKFATWNIGGGFISSDDEAVYDVEDISYFSDALKDVCADIACLQEIHISENNHQPEIIAKALGYDHVASHSIADSHLKNGEKLSIAIVSKYHIVSSQFHELPNPNLEFVWNGKKAFSHDKGFLEVVIDIDGTQLRVLSGHMVPFRKFDKDFMDDEFADIRSKLESVICDSDIPTIVGADMNFNEIEKALPRVFENGFTLALPHECTTPRGGYYDKIIGSNEVKFSNSQIIRGKADHYLCAANTDTSI